MAGSGRRAPRHGPSLAGQPVVRGHCLDAPLGPNVRALLVDCPPLYDRPGVYGEHTRTTPTTRCGLPSSPWRRSSGRRGSLSRFRWFTRTTGRPDFCPVYNAPPATECLHDSQPRVSRRLRQAVGAARSALRWEDFTVAGFEFWDRLSFLKAGVMFSDALTTVSPTYAQEIQRPEYGYGFDGVMRHRARRARRRPQRHRRSTSGTRRETRFCRRRLTRATRLASARPSACCWSCLACR